MPFQISVSEQWWHWENEMLQKEFRDVQLYNTLS